MSMYFVYFDIHKRSIYSLLDSQCIYMRYSNVVKTKDKEILSQVDM